MRIYAALSYGNRTPSLLDTTTSSVEGKASFWLRMIFLACVTANWPIIRKGMTTVKEFSLQWKIFVRRLKTR